MIKKDIARLAEIGEESVRGKLTDAVYWCRLPINDMKNYGTYKMGWDRQAIHRIQMYRNVRNNAVSLGVDVSEFDRQVLELTGLYSMLTKELDFAITEAGVEEKSKKYDERRAAKLAEATA